jgi:hypothetical protein
MSRSHDNMCAGCYGGRPKFKNSNEQQQNGRQQRWGKVFSRIHQYKASLCVFPLSIRQAVDVFWFWVFVLTRRWFTKRLLLP